MKLIVISGAKNSKKDLLAMSLANNPDVVWIKPYSNRKIPVNADPHDDFIALNDRQLNVKLSREVPLAETIVKGNRYIFFENQLKGEYAIIVGDDKVVYNIENNWDGDVISIRCHSRLEKSSSRFLMADEEFDYVFNWENDDLDKFVEMILDA